MSSQIKALARRKPNRCTAQQAQPLENRAQSSSLDDPSRSFRTDCSKSSSNSVSTPSSWPLCQPQNCDPRSKSASRVDCEATAQSVDPSQQSRVAGLLQHSVQRAFAEPKRFSSQQLPLCSLSALQSVQQSQPSSSSESTTFQRRIRDDFHDDSRRFADDSACLACQTLAVQSHRPLSCTEACRVRFPSQVQDADSIRDP